MAGDHFQQFVEFQVVVLVLAVAIIIVAIIIVVVAVIVIIIAVIVDAVPGAVPVLIIGQRQQFVREQEIQFPAILLRAFPDRVEFSAVHAHGPRGLRARLPLIQRKRSSVFHHKKSSLSLF